MLHIRRRVQPPHSRRAHRQRPLKRAGYVQRLSAQCLLFPKPSDWLPDSGCDGGFGRARPARPSRRRRAEALGLRYEGHLRGLIRPAPPSR